MPVTAKAMNPCEHQLLLVSLGTGSWSASRSVPDVDKSNLLTWAAQR
jgi:hypothetical protein